MRKKLLFIIFIYFICMNVAYATNTFSGCYYSTTCASLDHSLSISRINSLPSSVSTGIQNLYSSAKEKYSDKIENFNISCHMTINFLVQKSTQASVTQAIFYIDLSANTSSASSSREFDVTKDFEGFNLIGFDESLSSCPEMLQISFADKTLHASKRPNIAPENSYTLVPSSSIADEDIDRAKSTSIRTCSSFNNDKPGCENNPDFACVYNEKYNFCNTDDLIYVSCGSAFDIPSQVPSLISFAVNLLKIATPIILIFVGIITLVKALAASKEDEIKKAQSSLVKKLIAGALVFFIISIVQLVTSIVADDAESQDLSTCLECFLNNKCDGNAYYRTNIAGTDTCTELSTKELITCPEKN